MGREIKDQQTQRVSSQTPRFKRDLSAFVVVIGSPWCCDGGCVSGQQMGFPSHSAQTHGQSRIHRTCIHDDGQDGAN